MKGYVEILCYSNKQRDLLREHGSEAGVVLIDGDPLPRLTTETVSNMRLKSAFNREWMEEADRDESGPPKSAWSDAAVLLTSDGKGYQRLVDGTGKVTASGKAWCKANDVKPFPEALREYIEQPDCVRVPLRVMTPLKLKMK